MSQTPITVTYDIKELFTNPGKKIDDAFGTLRARVDKLDEKVNKIELEQGKMAVKSEKIETDITELKGLQNKLVFVLVGIIGAVVATGSIVALWRTFFTNNLQLLTRLLR